MKDDRENSILIDFEEIYTWRIKLYKTSSANFASVCSQRVNSSSKQSNCERKGFDIYIIMKIMLKDYYPNLQE